MSSYKDVSVVTLPYPYPSPSSQTDLAWPWPLPTVPNDIGNNLMHPDIRPELGNLFHLKQLSRDDSAEMFFAYLFRCLVAYFRSVIQLPLLDILDTTLSDLHTYSRIHYISSSPLSYSSRIGSNTYFWTFYSQICHRLAITSPPPPPPSPPSPSDGYTQPLNPLSKLLQKKKSVTLFGNVPCQGLGTIRLISRCKYVSFETTTRLG